MSLFRRQSDLSSEDPEEDETSSSQESSSDAHSELTSQKLAVPAEDDRHEAASDDGGVSAAESSNGGSHTGSVSTWEVHSEPPSVGGAAAGPGLDGHRNMMLATLLEDYFRIRAADTLNATNPGERYTRDSPEVQALAQRLFQQAGEALAARNLLPSSSVSRSAQDTRRQYLSALDNLAAGQLAPSAATDLLNPMRDLTLGPSHLPSLPHPANDLQLSPMPSPVRSHYLSNFREVRLLGKGGFGKVFECHNTLDQSTYAIKKIPLPANLIKRFIEGGHGGMEEKLREVQAMAKLDHVNVVRYHATWLEQPQPRSSSGLTRDQAPHSARSIATYPGRRRLLLEDRPRDISTASDTDSLVAPEKSESYDGIVFGDDTPSRPVDEDSHKSGSNGAHQAECASTGREITETWSADSTSNDLFTDGDGVAHTKDIGHQSDVSDGGDTHILYIQMSLYPLTLAQYLSSSPSKDNHNTPKHCYHLLPSLRLLLAILTGLQYIHANGLIHRDIKPGNIFLSDPKTVFDYGYYDVSCRSCAQGDEDKVLSRWLNPRIGDFGLVTQLVREGMAMGSADEDVLSSHKRGTGGSDKPVGTTYYSPPPWKGSGGARGDDEKIDVFSLGVIFTEMLWRCETAMERADMLQDLQKAILPSGLAQKLEAEGLEAAQVDDVLALARAMVNPNPSQRWSGTQVREAVEGLLGQISHLHQ